MTLIIWVLAIGSLIFGLAKAGWSYLIWTLVVGSGLLVLTLTGYLSVIFGDFYLGFVCSSCIAQCTRVACQNFEQANACLYPKGITADVRYRARGSRGGVLLGGKPELFRGNPDWHKLLVHMTSELSSEEQAFLDGPVEEFCQMIDDWEITNDLNDLSDKSWEYLKKNKFFGMDHSRKNTVAWSFPQLLIRQ